MGKKLLLLLSCCTYLLCYAQQPKDFMIPVKVTVNELQPSINISWPADANAQSYSIKRKTVSSTSYLLPFTTIGVISNAGGATQFTDNNIDAGVLYEYEISGIFSPSLPATRNSFVCAGIRISPVHQRGSIVLLCESSIAAGLEDRIATLYHDLTGDGWKVIRFNIPMSDENSAVKGIRNNIINAYHDNPDLKQVLIIGHVPVPYSGDLDPDGHTEHIGSWPADGYYGDMAGTWTDTITSHSLAGARPQTKNFPGDGKFDQSNLPLVQLAVGRIDLSNLPAFGIPETELLKKYLDKNHSFRAGETQLNKQALIDDALPSFTEKFSQSAWKSYAATVGYDNVLTGQYETDLLSPTTYLWSYGCGAGTYTGASGISYTSDFVSNSYKTVFTQLFGSFFGDWDSQDNFMRASLASAGNTLTCVWGGRPHWYLHHMSAGLPIGYAELLTMNNSNGIYSNPGSSSSMIHIGLMGDPSLRSSYIKPVKNVAAVAHTTDIQLRWNSPAEANIAGYFIYRSNTISGKFTLLNNSPVTDTGFSDAAPLEGKNVYMIRAVKIDTVITSGNYTNNSTYYNLAGGSFDSAFSSLPAPSVYLYPLDQSGICVAPKQVAIMGTAGKRYFVGEKNGQVNVFDSAFNFISLYLKVDETAEGLFSLAFHPDFEHNKLLYVLYSNSNGNLELSRFKEVDNNSASASFDGLMLKIQVTPGTKNLGGEIHFGPDGYLYISTGDGDTKDAAFGNAEKSNSLLGKILRINPNTSDLSPYYDIPADNPYGNEVFATGLRFPLRWEFDNLTNDVWIADRGDSSVEEINRISFDSLRTADFGWPCYEGATAINTGTASCGPASGYVFPVYDYPSPDLGSSVTGGTVYRGDMFLALRGYYIFADANNGNIYLSKYDSVTHTYTTVSQQVSPGAISDISAAADGELYVTSLQGGVYRLEANGPLRYRFSGNGNWDDVTNWSNNKVPPSVLPAGSEIIISPAVGGECVLNVPQTIPSGSKIIIADNRHFRISGDLIIQ